MISSAATPTRTAEHSISIDAPPAAVYAMVADVASWPHTFERTIHAEVLAGQGREQRLRIWSLADGEIYSWTSQRSLDCERGVVDFRQVITAGPVESMGGQWRIAPVDGGSARVSLRHDYSAIGNDPAALALIERAVGRDSRAELMALRNAAELGNMHDELQYTFSDSVYVDGSADDVYDFLDRADLWPDRMTHVVHAELGVKPGGVQRLEMETLGVDDSVHHTESVRVCFPDRRMIAYKQLRMPIMLRSHTGCWVVEAGGADRPNGSRATAQHTVTLDPEGVRQALGPTASMAEARSLVKVTISENTRKALRFAGEYAECCRG